MSRDAEVQDVKNQINHMRRAGHYVRLVRDKMAGKGALSDNPIMKLLDGIIELIGSAVNVMEKALERALR